MRIQHNIMAMNAYRNYTNNVSAMKSNLEKLSSGYKINRAGDDAAGLAISEKMRAQITGLETAQKNAKDGISLVQTAEGALTEVHDMLNRMVELATQSANGTYDNTTDRDQLQKEVNQLRSEINRIADSSNFNGIKLLDGSMSTKITTTGDLDLYNNKVNGDGALGFEVEWDGQLGREPQAGVFELDLSNFSGVAAADGEVKITVFGQEVTVGTYAQGDIVSGTEIAKAVAEKFGGTTSTWNNDDYGVGFGLTASQNNDKVTFTMNKAPSKPWETPAGLSIEGLTNANEKGDAVGNQAHGLQVRTLVEPVDNTSGRRYAQASINADSLAAKIVDGSTLKIGDTTYVFSVGKNSAFKDAQNRVDLTDVEPDVLAAANPIAVEKLISRLTTAAQDNKNFKVTGQSTLDGAANQDHKIYITELEGGVDTENYKLEGKPNDTGDDPDGDDGDWTGLLKFGKMDAAKSTYGLRLQIGDTADSYNQLVVNISDCHTDSLGIGDISVADQDSAAKAINSIKNAINRVSDIRGTLGATQNRLDHTINNLSVMTENIQDAESTIRDTDVAAEMMQYTKNNILIQSAQAMLAQANQVPQGVLQLLQ